MSQRTGIAARSLYRLSEYVNYGALAYAAGVPITQLPLLRRAPNLIPALPGCHPEARIVDVGAHRGEWGEVCARLFPRGRILSIEPVADHYRDVLRRTERVRNWEVLNVGVGDTFGRMAIDVRGERSSMKELQGGEFPEWAVGNRPSTGTEMVNVDTLDSLLAERRFYPVDLLKIDAEGYEREILRGAGETLKQTRHVLIEVRFYELFKGGPLFQEIHDLLAAAGFALIHLKPCKGTCLWADATYARTSLSQGPGRG
jgi:FkbM family methyltransferase